MSKLLNCDRHDEKVADCAGSFAKDTVRLFGKVMNDFAMKKYIFESTKTLLLYEQGELNELAIRKNCETLMCSATPCSSFAGGHENAEASRRSQT